MKVKAKRNFVSYNSQRNREFHFEEGKEYFVIRRKNDVMVKHPDGFLAIVSKEEFRENFE